MKTAFLALASPVILSFPAFAEEDPVPFRAQTIDDRIELGYGLAVADVDGDGQADVVLADKREILWYRAPDWTRFVMARNLTLRDNVCLAARDLDGDGKCEVAAGGNWNPGETVDESQSGSVHYLIPPEDRTQPWSAVALPHEPTVHRMHWARTRPGRWSLLVQPLHGRGNSPEGEGDSARFCAYHLPKDPSRADQWQKEVLDASLHQSHNFDVRQSESGAEAVLLAGREGLMLSEAGAAFRLEMDAAGFEGNAGAGEARFGPVFTYRGRSLVFYTTIEPMHGNEVVVYRAINGVDGSDGWERTVVDDSLGQGHAIACADLLGLGREQIVAGWREPNAQGRTGVKLYVWELGEWLSLPLDGGEMACEDLKIADLNQDGKLDIVASGRASRNVVIYWNEANIQPPPEPESPWKKHVLWTGAPCHGAVAADFTGDGIMDAAFNAGGRAHLLAGPDWAHRFLSAPGAKAGGIHCAAMDVDGDGDLDFIDCPRQLSWLENPGKEAVAAGAPWTSRVIDRDLDGIHCVLPADVNQDGKLDLIANQFNPVGPVADSLLWYETPAERDAGWNRHILADGDAPGGSHYLGFGDLNGDALPDLAAAAKGQPFENGHWFAWWKNPGSAAIAQPWEKALVAGEQWRATNILPADVDGDGDNDLVASRGHGAGVVWFDNVRGDGTGWELWEIDPLIASPHCLAVADLDGDGDLDAASCGYADRIVAWYENDGKGDFLIHDIDHGQEAYDLRAVDMDGDEDLDLLLAGRNSKNVVYYENPQR